MERNLDRRIEALVFVRDPHIKQHLRHTVLDTLLADNDPRDGAWYRRQLHDRRGSTSRTFDQCQKEILRQYTTSAS